MPKARKTNEELYEEAERAAVMEAVQDTEQEIFDDALNRDPDDNDGDTSLEEMDGEDVLDDDSEEEEGEDDGEGEEGETGGEGEGEETPPETLHQPDDRRGDRNGVPSARLREEAERRRAIEAEREQARAEARELRARLEALERGQQRPQGNQQNQPPDDTDIFADPNTWKSKLRAEINQDFEDRRRNDSFADAHETHGEKFVAAFQDLQRSNNPAQVAQILNSRNPGKSLMDWHKRQSVMGEIGDDLDGFIERKLQERLSDPEVRKSVITGARNDALRGDGGQPRTQTRLPPSLNSATGGTSHRSGTMNGRSRDTARTSASIEQEIFDSVWDD